MSNKSIDLCGFGNSLVDFQFELNEHEIAELGINKGEMRLIDENIMANLFNKLQNKPHYKCSGGSAANTIIAFSEFGGKAAYITVLGNDSLSEFYSNEFNGLGVILHAPKLPDEDTGKCLILITPDAERTMNTYLGATSKFSPEHVKEELIAQANWLYIEGYEFSGENSTRAIFKSIELAKHYNTKISVTFSDAFITEVFNANLLSVVKQADLVFCNENEALSFAKTNSIEEAEKYISEICPNYVITKGANGSLIRWQGETLQVPAYHTVPKDTTGAGDMFAAGFLYGIIKTNNPLFAGDLASYAASRVVSQFGARLKENYIEIKDKIQSKHRTL